MYIFILFQGSLIAWREGDKADDLRKIFAMFINALHAWAKVALPVKQEIFPPYGFLLKII